MYNNADLGKDRGKQCDGDYLLFKISLRSSGLVFFKYALIYVIYQITLKYIGIFNFLAFLTSFLKKITW